MRTLDLFAGAGGWDIAAVELGLDVYGAEIMPEARATREAAGLVTPWHDVRDVSDWAASLADVHLASPPCQSFSMAGSGSGRRALDAVIRGVQSYYDGRPLSYDALMRQTGDERTALVLEPLRLALAGCPRLIAWEQVPTVFPVWEACADVLEQHDYSVKTAILNAEQYGVPQTRRRAILVASLDGPASLPTPTHSRYHNRDPKRLDPGVPSWVSMADALGWGMSGRPSMTVCGGGTDTGGAEPFGNAARQGIKRELGEGRWVYRTSTMPNATERALDVPAPTVAFGNDANSARWVQRSNYADGGKPGQTAAERGRTTRDLEQPSVAITGKPPQWAQDGAESIRITVEEAAVLQTFPADYPWRGGKGKQYQQIGNAIPPVLAHAILTALLEGS